MLALLLCVLPAADHSAPKTPTDGTVEVRIREFGVTADAIDGGVENLFPATVAQVRLSSQDSDKTGADRAGFLLLSRGQLETLRRQIEGSPGGFVTRGEVAALEPGEEASWKRGVERDYVISVAARAGAERGDAKELEPTTVTILDGTAITMNLAKNVPTKVRLSLERSKVVDVETFRLVSEQDVDGETQTVQQPIVRRVSLSGELPLAGGQTAVFTIVEGDEVRGVMLNCVPAN